MKRIWVILLLATAVRGADVTLLMTGQTMVPNFVRIAATCQATRMFAGIGVRLESKKRNVHSQGMVIQVRFIDGPPGHPAAWAFRIRSIRSRWSRSCTTELSSQPNAVPDAAPRSWLMSWFTKSGIC